jgi:hypothetical protein
MIGWMTAPWWGRQNSAKKKDLAKLKGNKEHPTDPSHADANYGENGQMTGDRLSPSMHVLACLEQMELVGEI